MATNPLTARHVAMQQLGFYDGSQGYGAGQESKAYQALTPEQKAKVQAATSVAAAPALAEPLHQYEKQALQGLSNTGGLDQGNMAAAVDMLKSYMGEAFAPITQEQVAGVQNPYSDALKSRLSESAEKLRASMLANEGMRGAQSFGDTATGIRQGEIDRGVMQGESEIDYKTFQDALAQIQGQRGLQATAGVDAASSLFGMGQGQRQSGISDLQNQLGAGGYIRGYNQDINNQILQNVMGQQGYNLSNLQNTYGLLQNYGSQMGQTGGMANSTQQLGGMLQGAGQIGGAIFGGRGGNVISTPTWQSNNLPWLS